MIQVENVTRNMTLVDQGRMANNFWTRFKGLMGVRSLDPGDGLLISPANCIHTHWMLIPIDVLYLNEAHQVVDMDVEMKPWRIGKPRPQARFVLELPAGEIARTGVNVGDQLQVAA